MTILKEILRKNLKILVLFILSYVINLIIFILYDIIIEPFLYSVVFGLIMLTATVIIDCIRETKRSKERKHSIVSVVNDFTDLPEAHTLAEKDYQIMIEKMGKRFEKLEKEYDEEWQDATDYYTTWVHQIKTPIAVMKMKLSEDNPENRALQAEVFRIEQYVDMVLQYIRLGSSTNDLVIREYPIDELIRESIHKFAPQFVGKKLKLDYSPSDMTITTDKKWFQCILDQLISNAVKYTPSGVVSISVNDDILTITDTGIGIAKEDLPRIFEKGYTGNNGRLGQKSSGLGLYLAKKAADMLSLQISANSTQGKGSSFSINLKKN